MASVSRNQRHKARMKRTNSLLKRELQAQMNERYKTHVMLLAVLAQKGGEVTITEGTLAQVVASLRQLSYTINTTEVKGESIIRLVTKEIAEDVPLISSADESSDAVAILAQTKLTKEESECQSALSVENDTTPSPSTDQPSPASVDTESAERVLTPMQEL